MTPGARAILPGAAGISYGSADDSFRPHPTMTAMHAKRPHFELFTDGACSGNPGPGGWAYILRDPERSTETERADGESSTTNNRMELISVIEGLKALDEPSVVDLYSDSQYVVKGLTEWMDRWKARGWKRPKHSTIRS